MIHVFLRVVFFLILITGVFGCNNDSVYICKGHLSKAYHKSESCYGLKWCSKEILEVSKEKAVKKHHRHACSFCY